MALDPRVAYAGNVNQELAQVVERDGIADQHLVREVEVSGALGDAIVDLREDVADGIGGAPPEVGARVRHQLEEGDAGIVNVVVGPHVVREALDVPQAFGPEGLVELAPRSRHRAGDETGGGYGHRLDAARP